MNNKGISTLIVLLIILGVVLVGSGVVYYYVTMKPQQKLVACTMEAKLCPDGSAVGRTGPNCEFAECPNQIAGPALSEVEGWKTYTNEEFGFEMKYPVSGIGSAKEPIISISDCNFDNFSAQCPNSSALGIEQTSPDLTAEKIHVSSTPICKYINNDGAAGTTYSTYYYVVARNKKCLTVKLDYISHVTSCGVYGTPEEKNYIDCEVNLSKLNETINSVPFTFKFTK